MRIALTSDEKYPVHRTVMAELAKRGHTVIAMGAIASEQEESWAEAAEAAAQLVAGGGCDEGIFFCWSGTGIAMAANKVAGIRAALCTDPPTAAAARIWNHANVLCLSNRTLSDDVAKEILAAWFDTVPDGKGDTGVSALAGVEIRHRRG